MIEPQDEAQQVALREILMRYQDKLWDIDIAHREGLKAHMDAVLAELRPILSEEQFRRVERRRRRLGELMGPWRDGRRNRQRE